jgi:hypothetical protein
MVNLLSSFAFKSNLRRYSKVMLTNWKKYKTAYDDWTAGCCQSLLATCQDARHLTQQTRVQSSHR